MKIFEEAASPETKDSGTSGNTQVSSPRKFFPEKLVTFEKFIRGLKTSFKTSHYTNLTYKIVQTIFKFRVVNAVITRK